MQLEHRPHDFQLSLQWTGAAKGPTASYRGYSRDLALSIPGKPTLAASSAAAFLGDATLHNPEDLLMGALSACHCLSYLALAAREHLLVVDYADHATGTMEWDGSTYHFTKVTLAPVVTLQKGADRELARALHEKAHEACFIAKSVNFPVENRPTILEAV